MLQVDLQKIEVDIGNFFQKRILGVLAKEEISFLENLEDLGKYMFC